MMGLVPIAILFMFSYSQAIPIDNSVEGEPEIECSADSITINFNTKNEFQGHVYVKGRYNEDQCRSDEKGKRIAGIKLSFSSCGTKRDRSLNPKGVYVTNTVVISFHAQFLTKVDRAYTIQCFYMEADKTVSQNLEASDITSAFQTQVVPMPVCRYDILEGGPTGAPVKFAVIGQQVYHKWTCETQAVDVFCALVHSCFVDDGAGNKIQLLNEQGCALDKYLLNNLEYQSDLMAGHESHVFKYADKPALAFQCQITILIKEPGQPCVRPQCSEAGAPYTPVPNSPKPPPRPPSVRPVGKVTPYGNDSQPQTTAAYVENDKPEAKPTLSRPDFSGLAARLRRIRSPTDKPLVDFGNVLGTWDVNSQLITTLDIDAGDYSDARKFLDKQQKPSNSNFISKETYKTNHVCVSPIWLGLIIATCTVTFICGISCAFIFLKKQMRKA